MEHRAAKPAATADEDLESQAVPLKERPAKADFPLPPEELVGELDNSGVSKSDEAESGSEEVATLDFFGDELPFKDFSLRYRFRLDGREVDSVRVRQLTTAEVGRITQDWARTRQAPDNYVLYAAMTGLPAAVLRALPAGDGEPILECAFDFLPLLFRGEAG